MIFLRGERDSAIYGERAWEIWEGAESRSQQTSFQDKIQLAGLGRGVRRIEGYVIIQGNMLVLGLI